MKVYLFDQERLIEKCLDEWSSRSIDAKCEVIHITGKPDIKFDGTQEYLKLRLRIENVELCRIIHPVAYVDERPSSGNCMMEIGKRCEFRRKDGRCTSDPFDNEKCEFNDGHCEE